MFVKNLSDCEKFSANDGCDIQELLHPANDLVDIPYSIAIASVQAGKRSYKHRLEQSEVYFILSGSGIMHMNDKEKGLQQGDVVLIPAGSVQWLENTGEDEIQFMAIVSPPWTEAGDIRLE